jgi:transcriptional regulator with XRE-family HTH domain
MLEMFTRKITPSRRVNNAVSTSVNSPPSALWTLVDLDLLRKLMARTGDGCEITVRELAARAGVAVGTIGKLITGAQLSVRAEAAQSIADAIGVGVLILFAPPRGATLTVARIAECVA